MGKTADKINIWETITSDQWILNTICGCNIKLSEIPTQTFVPKPLNFPVEEREKISTELDRFLSCGITEHASQDRDNEFISNIFIRRKKDERVCIIIES